jgi:predicted DNA-binding protein (MmcQ/YjbR family)
MTVEDIRAYCLKLKGTTESIKWENHLCFSVGDKMYIILSPDSLPVSCSFKTSDELFDELPLREGIIPAPYLARYKWVHLDNIDRLTKKEWTKYITIAYNLVFEKLPAKAKAKISGKK